MESLVDIVTTTFQAILVVCIVFTAGYAYNATQSGSVFEVSAGLPLNVTMSCGTDMSCRP
jgi:hypothetical protein